MRCSPTPRLALLTLGRNAGAVPPGARRSCRAAAPVLLVVVGACLVEPFEPAGAAPLGAAPVYATWWQQMETCAQITAPMSRVDWYEVRGAAFGTPQGPRWGWWQPPHTIYLAAAHVLDAHLVEHEMLHDLLQIGTHPPIFQACGVAYPNDAPPE